MCVLKPYLQNIEFLVKLNLKLYLVVLLYAIDYKDYILSHKVSYNLKLLCEVYQNELNRSFLSIFNFL